MYIKKHTTIGSLTLNEKKNRKMLVIESQNIYMYITINHVVLYNVVY